MEWHTSCCPYIESHPLRDVGGRIAACNQKR
jgi:hypothetical protein